MYKVLFSLCLIGVSLDAADGPPFPRREPTGKAYIDMDYGAFKTHTLEVDKGNFANKAIAIRLDPGEGGVSSGREFMVFETDTLRWAAGWGGVGFNNWKNIMHDGGHGTHLAIVGDRVFANPDAPGWADREGEFVETRFLGRDKRRYGPMDPSVGRWKGLYRHGDQVVLSYEIGGSDVLELAGAEGPWPQRVFTRTLNLGPRMQDLIVQVAHEEGAEVKVEPAQPNRGAQGRIATLAAGGDKPANADDAGKPWITLDGATHLRVAQPTAIDMARSDFTWFARVKTSTDGTILSKTAPDSKWVPLGKTLFLRNGRLAYDVGWVGQVGGKKKINDGKFHRVAVTYEAKSGTVSLFVDGQPDGSGKLVIPGPDHPETGDDLKRMASDVLQIGFTAPDFPTRERASHLLGSIGDLRFYNRALSAEEIKGLGRRKSEYNDPRLAGRWEFRRLEGGKSYNDLAKKGHTATVIKSKVASAGGPSGTLMAAVVGGPDGTQWITSSKGHIRLRIPAGDEPARLKLVLGNQDNEAFQAAVSQTGEPADLKSLTRGGPAQWTETVTTKMSVLGPEDGAFVVERITVPFKNPYGAMMRLGGFDFFKDGKRAAVCTAMGDVWVVSGLGGDLGTFQWKRIATGMYEPLGLKIVDETIHVTCRDQITRLHDLNGDEEIDFYEAFNHDNQCSEHYHEFAMCLETDDQGNFYYVKASGHAMNARFPHHGALIKLSPDGSKSEIIAAGFRAPNGLWVSRDGQRFLTTDQEGHWTPKNRINWVEPGGFYGYMNAYAGEGRDSEDYTPPITWMHNRYENSPSEAFMVETDKWGPLNGKMAHISYGKGKVYHVMYERSPSGIYQGGITEMDIAGMPTGLSRARFHPGDGQLYACGLFVWCSNVTQIGGFYRIRYANKPLNLPASLRVAKDGIVIGFTDPLDREMAGDTGNYSGEMWNYLRRASYGSRDFKVLGQGQGHDPLEITAATVSADGKSIFLEMPKLQKTMQAHVDLNLKAADGTRIRRYIHFSVHEMGLQPGRKLLETTLAAQ